jgi:hypothetical protein
MTSKAKRSKARKRPSNWKRKDPKKGLHKDWRVWLGIALMVIAISIYVLTLDDSMELNAVNQGQTSNATGGQQQ